MDFFYWCVFCLFSDTAQMEDMKLTTLKRLVHNQLQSKIQWGKLIPHFTTFN